LPGSGGGAPGVIRREGEGGGHDEGHDPLFRPDKPSCLNGSCPIV